MKTLYFDVLCGASGDMILSSLIDVGVPEDFLRKELTKLAIPGFSMSVDKQKRSGIDCSHLTLSWDGLIKQVHSHADHDHAHEHHHDDDHLGGHGHGHAHHEHKSYNHEDHHHTGHEPLQFRNARQILEIIKKADYNEQVFSSCEKILNRISEAEAKVHGVSVEEVHFHEIGAIDTIIDVAGISLCLDYLNVNELRFSTLTDGRGTVHTRHGLMPVPVPATAKLCEGFALKILDIESELLTPTGCGVLTALGKQTGPGPSGTIIKTGYGCGNKVFENSPNAIRVFLMETESNVGFETDMVCCLESDMDHISGEIMGDAAGRLLQAGALDVSWCPVFMKKGRPGYRLCVLCAVDKKEELIDLIILHTRTLGVRVQTMQRVKAQRDFHDVQFLGSTVREKHCTYKNESFTKLEYESLAALSEKTGRPVIELMEESLKNKGDKTQ
jgi:pyridinium-3,5-bisthiocarboxylic acid mononucleotide nickel chelatase